MNNQLLSKDVRSLLTYDNSVDIIRYYLSLAVLFAHFAELTQTKNYFLTPSYTAVGGFFVLSGFLVFLSYTKSQSLLQYFKRRMARIFPPYFFIVILCALVGVFISELSVYDYFASSQFWEYLTSNLLFANFLQPSLPGVFENNVMSAVNGSLWTMKIEVMLYASIPIVALLLLRKQKAWVLLLIYLLSYIYKLWMGYLYCSSGDEIYRILQRQVGGQLMFFYSGAAILLYFDYFQKHIIPLFSIASVVMLASLWVTWFEFIEPLCLAILIIGFAYNCKSFSWMRKFDNIAYGIYLFHFPIIQLVVYWGIDKVNIYLAFVLVLFLTLLLSLLSWFYIEKPILKKTK
jgi:peptidoglycan/LPS O-acetylase OafA/YrhL